MSGSPLSEKKQTVLVAEDELFIRITIADYLRECGFRVLEAASADDALAIIKGDQAVDVVFSDVQMPGELDGFGLARWIRTNRPGIKVVLTSGMTNAAKKAGDLCEGGPLLTKPYDERQVVARIQQMLREAADRTG